MKINSTTIHTALVALTYCITLAAVIGGVFRWFHQPLAAPLDADEVAWVLDAEAFEWYYQPSWAAFRIDKPFTSYAWYDHEYRVIDQPQLGKYILGAQLSVSGLKPWQSSDKKIYYLQFAQRTLPTGTLDELEGKVNSSILKSIKQVRVSNTWIGFLAVCVAAFLVAQYLKNRWSGFYFLALVINHQLTLHYYRLAVVNAYSFLAQVLAVAVMYLGLKKVLILGEKMSSYHVTLLGWGALAGVLVALAGSIKLDGLFLLLGPFLWFYLFFALSFSKYQEAFEYQTWIVKLFFWLAGFVVFFGLSFIVLEPEIIVNGLSGAEALLASRLVQQDRFASAFANLTWLERGLLLSASFWQQSGVVKILLTLLFLHLGVKLYQARYFFINQKISWKKKMKASFGEDTLFVSLLAPVLLGSLYASRVGFDRYIIPAVVVSYLFLLRLVVSRRSYE